MVIAGDRIAPAAPAETQSCVLASTGYEEKTMLGTILIIFLILALIGAFPRWGHSREWGYFPTGGLGLVLLVVVILVILGRI
jgi:hypothetical protein